MLTNSRNCFQSTASLADFLSNIHTSVFLSNPRALDKVQPEQTTTKNKLIGFLPESPTYC
ncbi:MAG: hypothetical protein ACI808_003359 [Paraglaciecola sp.]|jgi:hypothetical protein